MSRDHDSIELLRPIFDRLAVKGTILRESEDGSMLLQALLDLRALPFVRECLY
jgi:hypothetical protein